MSGESLLSVSQTPLLTVFSHCRGEGAVLGLLNKRTKPIPERAIITSQKPHFQIPSCWGLSFNTGVLAVTDIQSVTTYKGNAKIKKSVDL